MEVDIPLTQPNTTNPKPTTTNPKPTTTTTPNTTNPKPTTTTPKPTTPNTPNLTDLQNPTFFVFHSLTKKTLGDMSPFFIEKSIQGLIGTVRKITKMRSGDLLVESPNPTITRNIMRVTAFGDIPISVTPHNTLNSSRGVIVSKDLLNETEEELKEGMKEQGVINVKRIMLRRDGVQVPSRVLILTFNGPKLPESVKAGYIHCTVRPYIPNPLRCFLCQRYGHSRNNCRGSPICSRCATSDHDFEKCQIDPVCANCQGAHPAYSRTCPKWQTEKAVQRYRVENNVSYPEARRIMAPSSDRPLYSTVSKRVMVSTEVQTEITVAPLETVHFVKGTVPCLPNPPRSSKTTTSSTATNTKVNTATVKASTSGVPSRPSTSCVHSQRSASQRSPAGAAPMEQDLPPASEKRPTKPAARKQDLPPASEKQATKSASREQGTLPVSEKPKPTPSVPSKPGPGVIPAPTPGARSDRSTDVDMSDPCNLLSFCNPDQRREDSSVSDSGSDPRLETSGGRKGSPERDRSPIRDTLNQRKGRTKVTPPQ